MSLEAQAIKEKEKSQPKPAPMIQGPASHRGFANKKTPPPPSGG